MLSDLNIQPERAFTYYPTAQEIDGWAESLLERSRCLSVTGEYTDDMPVKQPFGNGPNALINQYVRFATGEGRVFYGYWQPALKQPAPCSSICRDTAGASASTPKSTMTATTSCTSPPWATSRPRASVRIS